MANWRTQILLGTGGREPRVATYCPLTTRLEDVLRLAPGESVYAVAVEADGQAAVCGTKAGSVYELGEPPAAVCRRRAPILDVALPEEGLLAVADLTVFVLSQ